MNEIGHALADELRRLGATDIRFAHGSKHPRVVFVWEGREMYRVFSGTPSDAVRGVHKAMADLRRTLGLVRPEKRVGERRQRKAKTAEAPIRVPDCTVPTKADPMAALRRHPAHAVAMKQNLDAAWRALFIARSLEHGYMPVMAGATAIGAAP